MRDSWGEGKKYLRYTLYEGFMGEGKKYLRYEGFMGEGKQYLRYEGFMGEGKKYLRYTLYEGFMGGGEDILGIPCIRDSWGRGRHILGTLTNASMHSVLTLTNGSKTDISPSEWLLTAWSTVLLDNCPNI